MGEERSVQTSGGNAPLAPPSDGATDDLFSNPAYASLFQALPVGLFRMRVRRPPGERPEYDLHTTFVVDLISPRCAEILGVSPAELAASPRRIVDLVVPEDRESLRRAWAKSAEERSNLDWEGQIQHGGQRRWVRFRSVRRPLEDGWIEHAAVVEDVSDRHQTTTALRESESLLAAAFQGSPVSMVLSSMRDGTYRDVNGVFLRETGYRREEVIGRTSADLGIFESPEERERLVADVSSHGSVYGRPVRFRMKSGHLRECLLSSHIVQAGEEPFLLSSIIDISALAETQASLREANERLSRSEQLLNETGRVAGVGGWELEVASGKMSWTTETRRIKGVEGAFEPTVESALGFYHPEDRPRIAEAVQRAVEQGDSFDLELRLVTPDGTEKWVNALGNAAQSDGRVQRVSGTLRDVTTQRRAGNALRESEERLRRVTSTVPGLLYDYILDPAPFGRFLYVSPRSREILELEPRALLADSRQFWNLVHPDDRSRLEAENLAAFRQGQHFSSECRIVTPSGRTKWLQFLSRPNPSPPGVAAAWTGVAIDITDRKEAEAERKRLGDRLVLALEASGAGSWEWDLDSGELSWSPELYRLLELDPSSTVASFEAWRSRIHPEDLATSEAAMAASLRDRKPLRDRSRFVLPSGEVRWIEALGHAICDESGAVRRMSGLCIDVTDRVAIERELLRHREHLEDLVRARTAELEGVTREMESFSYSVSHDLRAPLRALDGFSAALADDYAHLLDDEAKSYLARIRVAAQRMGQLIDALLNLSRLGRRELARSPVDLTEMCRSVAAEVVRVEGKELELVVAPGLVADADPELLRIVLQNLIGNAAKFSAGRPQPRIEIGSRLADGDEAFFVRDNGVGFDMAYAGKLFKPFQRLHGVAEFPGTGIGLATVQRIVSRHGGRVWAQGVEGEGAIFLFTLPRALD